MSRLTQDKNLDLLAELYVAFGKNADELLGTDAGRDGAEPQRLGRLDGDDSCSSRPLNLVLRGTHSCQATRDGRYFFRITPGSPLENDYIESFFNGKLGMNCWIANCSIHCGRGRYSWSVGDRPIIGFAHTARWAITRFPEDRRYFGSAMCLDS